MRFRRVDTHTFGSENGGPWVCVRAVLVNAVEQLSNVYFLTATSFFSFISSWHCRPFKYRRFRRCIVSALWSKFAIPGTFVITDEPTLR